MLSLPEWLAVTHTRDVTHVIYYALAFATCALGSKFKLWTKTTTTFRCTLQSYNSRLITEHTLWLLDWVAMLAMATLTYSSDNHCLYIQIAIASQQCALCRMYLAINPILVYTTIYAAIKSQDKVPGKIRLLVRSPGYAHTWSIPFRSHACHSR